MPNKAATEESPTFKEHSKVPGIASSLKETSRPKAKNPKGRRPRVFLAEGLAKDVAEGLPEENPKGGLQSTPRARLSTQGTARGHRFTWLPLKLFHRSSFFLNPKELCGISSNVPLARV